MNINSQAITSHISAEINNRVPLQLVLNYNHHENISISETQAKEKAMIFLEKLIEINSNSPETEILIIPPVLEVAKHINIVSGTSLVDIELVQLLDKNFNVKVDETYKNKILKSAQETSETLNLTPLNWQESIDKLNEIMINHYSISQEFRGVEIMSQLLYKAERADVLGALEAANTIVSSKCSILLAVYGLYFIQDQVYFESNLGQLIRILNHSIKVKMSAIKSTLAASVNIAESLSELNRSENLVQNKISYEKPFFKRKPVLMMLGMGAFGIITVGTSIAFGDSALSSMAAESVKDIKPSILKIFAQEILKIGALSYDSNIK
jgi:hypothetical protein